MSPRQSPQYWLGIDFGTSGARAIVIDAQGTCIYENALTFGSSQDARSPQVWQTILLQLIADIPAEVKQKLAAIAINGTSSTVLLCDALGQPLLPPLMYGDKGDRGWVERLRETVPEGHCVLSASSSLVKLLTFETQPEFRLAQYFLHQADWLAGLLHGQFGVSDYHNSLKLGYDPATETYPNWFKTPLLHSLNSYLPRVLPPGTAMGRVCADVTEQLGLPITCQICTGTTDSISAFLASSASQPGEAVTSLGSTLVLKLLSTQRVDRSDYGIYSHRLGNLWLVGGASNTGGAVLAHFFTAADLATLSRQINPDNPSPLDYYPLLQPGERFPINDPDLPPRLTPRPADDAAFLHGLLESLAQIEAQGYRLLEACGASSLQQVLTAGGGAKNQVWTRIRQRLLQVEVRRSPQDQAAYGTARLAQRGTQVS